MTPPPPGPPGTRMAAMFEIDTPAAPPFIPLGGMGGGEKIPAPAQIMGAIHGSAGHRGPPSPPAMPQQPAIPDWPDLPPVVMPPDWPSEEFLFNQPNTPNRPYAPPESPMYPPWAPDAPLLPPPGWPQAPPLPVGDQPPLPPSVPDFPNTSMDTYYGETYDWEENGVEEESYDQHAMRVMSVHGSSGHHDMSVMSVDERDDGIGPGTTVEPVDPVNHPELLDALRPRSQHQGHVNGGFHRFTSRIPPRQESHMRNLALSSGIGLVALAVVGLGSYRNMQRQSRHARLRGLQAMDREDFESDMQFDEECQPLTSKLSAYGSGL